MDFNDDVGLDTSQVSDVRGRKMGGAAIGGGVSLIGLIIALVLGVNPGDLVGGGSAGVQSGPVPASDLRERCRTGADAEEHQDCRIVAVVNSVQKYWDGAMRQYEQAQTQLFNEATNTGCGHATSAVGPFYCPADSTVYLDLGFFSAMKTQLGAQGGEFAQAYVVAHEYGHHVQNVLGATDRVARSRESGPKSPSVRLELQADCYAGVWAANAVETGFIANLSRADIDDGLDAAASVGDDRIQERAQGRVDPESWTHGSSEQRQVWFLRGYESGSPRQCDTFAANAL
ncbi:MAG TPA: neutral zinc metallopeptidase [Frankiaceae bacterium]|nr:neutral zinc metallopeptidase [Frankiaceae bacterium]